MATKTLFFAKILRLNRSCAVAVSPLAARARPFSSNVFSTRPLTTLPEMDDIPNEEYCSFTVGDNFCTPINSTSHTVRFLVSLGTAGMPGPVNEKYPLQTVGMVGPYELKGVKEGLYARLDIPGIAKDRVTIWAEKDRVFVIGDGRKESKQEESGRKYNARIDLCPKANYETNDIKAEVNNGTLRMIIPKSKTIGEV
uniref:SHSP domain-containing protein n=1 Tax=Davidia involucrata TaxID=16924 RepID=A0A5B7CAM4_DAVIN